MATQPWARRMAGMGRLAAVTSSTAQGLSTAQGAMQTLLAQAASALAGGTTWATVGKNYPPQASKELQQLVAGNLLSQADATSLLSQFNISLDELAQAPAAAPASLFAPAAAAAPGPTGITLMGQTFSDTEVIIGVVVIGGLLWMMFSGKKSR
jgi:hypothetical protein